MFAPANQPRVPPLPGVVESIAPMRTLIRSDQKLPVYINNKVPGRRDPLYPGNILIPWLLCCVVWRCLPCSCGGWASGVRVRTPRGFALCRGYFGCSSTANP